MKRRQKFADELKWLQGHDHARVRIECTIKKPRKESQISVTIRNENVSHKHHTKDSPDDTANRPRVELHISVMIRSEITSVIYLLSVIFYENSVLS